jgi:hypothetical protein
MVSSRTARLTIAQVFAGEHFNITTFQKA